MNYRSVGPPCGGSILDFLSLSRGEDEEEEHGDATAADAVTVSCLAVFGGAFVVERVKIERLLTGNIFGRCLLERKRCEPPREWRLFSCTLSCSRSASLARSGVGTICSNWLGQDPDLNRNIVNVNTVQLLKKKYILWDIPNVDRCCWWGK